MVLLLVLIEYISSMCIGRKRARAREEKERNDEIALYYYYSHFDS